VDDLFGGLDNEARSHLALQHWMVFSLDVHTAMEDEWDRDEIPREFSGCRNFALVNTVMEFDRDIVLDGFRRIEVDAARRCWRDRLQGSSDEMTTVKVFLAIAKDTRSAT
jgi:hypothetical protein